MDWANREDGTKNREIRKSVRHKLCFFMVERRFSLTREYEIGIEMFLTKRGEDQEIKKI